MYSVATLHEHVYQSFINIVLGRTVSNGVNCTPFAKPTAVHENGIIL